MRCTHDGACHALAGSISLPCHTSLPRRLARSRLGACSDRESEAEEVELELLVRQHRRVTVAIDERDAEDRAAALDEFARRCVDGPLAVLCSDDVEMSFAPLRAIDLNSL